MAADNLMGFTEAKVVNMNKHTTQLERLCQKFQMRYGENDAVVKELHDAIVSARQDEDRVQRWHSHGFKPHEEHTVALAHAGN